MKIRIPTKIYVKEATLKRVCVVSLIVVLAMLVYLFIMPVKAYAYTNENQTEDTTVTPAATVVDNTNDDETDTDIDGEAGDNENAEDIDVVTPNSATPPSSATGTMTDEVQDGTGSTTDNSDLEAAGKQFVTIETKSGKIFYMILDYDKATDNVYLLTEVTENDLLNFVEVTDDGTGMATTATAIGDDTTANSALPSETDQEDTEPEPEVAKKSNTTTLLIILLIAGAGGGAYYYFKIRKPKGEPLGSLDDLDYEDDEDYSDDEDMYMDDDNEQEDNEE